MKLSAFLSSLALVIVSGSAQEDTCPLTCHPGSVCVIGDADFSPQPKDSNDIPFEFHKETNKGGWHCDCPEGLTGLRCNRQYQKCENDHYCYHGGKCIAGLDEKIASDQLFCDCSDAEHNGFPFVGKYCEIQGAVQCGDSEIFCTNGGTCEDNFESMAHPCNCPVGHRGPHCEFDTGFVPDCTLSCENGGECTLGIKDYDSAVFDLVWAQQDGNFQYCSCPPGYFGLNCEVEGQECGSGHCLNGGSCLQTEHTDGTMQFVCDCTTAYTDDTSYAGQFCENESTSFCSKSETANGQLFCTNGGKCVDEEHVDCECLDGFHGPICEFRDDVQDEEECNLQCENDGSCRTGNKDLSLFSKFGDELSRFNETHRLWEHCVCPDGFFGVQCEHQLQICPGGSQVCLHGSTCVAQQETNGLTTHTCDCDDSNNGVDKFAGKFCQYTSTDICTKSGQPGLGQANFAFCVNNGVCKDKVDEDQEHPGCNCKDGFVGDHCEYLESSQNSASQVSNNASGSSGAVNTKKQTSNGLIASLVIAILVLVVLIGMSLFKRRSGKESEGDSPPIPEPEAMQSTANIAPSDMTQSDESTVSHKDLQTVEII